jgi:hypothetical protein
MIGRGRGKWDFKSNENPANHQLITLRVPEQAPFTFFFSHAMTREQREVGKRKLSRPLTEESRNKKAKLDIENGSERSTARRKPSSRAGEPPAC